MARIVERIRELLEYHRLLKIRRSIAMAMTLVIVFVTAYSMTMSAVSMERKTAESMPGMTLGKESDTKTTRNLNCPLQIHKHTRVIEKLALMIKI